MLVLGVSLPPDHHVTALYERHPAAVRAAVHRRSGPAASACAVRDLLHLRAWRFPSGEGAVYWVYWLNEDTEYVDVQWDL